MHKTRNIANLPRYYFTRVLQKLGLSDLRLQVGVRSACIIPNPPLATKAFATTIGERQFRADPSLQAVLHLVENAQTFWDIGANVGFFSILARDVNPNLQVVSIEASTEHYQVLCRNWHLNPNGWICLHLAVGNGEGLIKMSQGLGGFDHVLSDSEVGQYEFRPMMKLDSIARLIGHETIDVMKIDVEGMELSVLQGALCLLKSKRVKWIVLENDGHDRRYGHTNNELIGFLTSKAYKLVSERSGKPSLYGDFQVFRADD